VRRDGQKYFLCFNDHNRWQRCAHALLGLPLGAGPQAKRHRTTYLQRFLLEISGSPQDDAWVRKIKVTPKFTFEHLRQFIELWSTIRDFPLEVHAEDDIV
jgi:hypothetical protein